MPTGRFTLPEVKVFLDTRPSACTYGGSVYLNRHGPVTECIRDLHVNGSRLTDIDAATVVAHSDTTLRELTVMARVTESGRWRRS